MGIKIIIPGQPQGKARGRTFIHNVTGRPTTMTPQKTVLYENLIKSQWIQSRHELMKGMLKVDITAYYQIPKSKSKKIKEQMSLGQIRPTTKPDADNVAKVVCDALNEVAYHDDTQIVELTVHKWYSENPRVEVEVMKEGE